MRDWLLKCLCGLSTAACVVLSGFIFYFPEIPEHNEVMITYTTPGRPRALKPAKPSIPDEDIDLIALVTMAEAEDEPEEGKRLVIDTILNRTDHSSFPDTVSEVVYQKWAYSSMWNGRVDRCYISNEIRKLVVEELESRTDSDVIFFRTNHYSEYGEPLYQVGNHYFSGY